MNFAETKGSEFDTPEKCTQAFFIVQKLVETWQDHMNSGSEVAEKLI